MFSGGQPAGTHVDIHFQGIWAKHFSALQPNACFSVTYARFKSGCCFASIVSFWELAALQNVTTMQLEDLFFVQNSFQAPLADGGGPIWMVTTGGVWTPVVLSICDLKKWTISTVISTCVHVSYPYHDRRCCHVICPYHSVHWFCAHATSKSFFNVSNLICL